MIVKADLVGLEQLAASPGSKRGLYRRRKLSLHPQQYNSRMGLHSKYSTGAAILEVPFMRVTMTIPLLAE